MTEAKKHTRENYGFKKVKNSAIIPQPKKELKTTAGVLNWWRFGVDNLFPNDIAFLNRTSPAHGGILESKRDYCKSAGIRESEIKDPFLYELFEHANNEDQDLWDLSGDFFATNFDSGNIWLEIVTNKQRNFLNLFIRDYTTLRLGRATYEGYGLMYPDWDRIVGINATQKIPLYPNFIDINGSLHSMLFLKRNVAGFPQYGLPRWLSALDAAEIGKGVNIWNKLRVKKGFSSDGILEADFNSVDEANEAEKKFNEKKAGDENAGNIIFIKKAVGQQTSPANFVQFNRTSEGEFLSLRNLSVDDLVMAHGWFRSLCSLPDNTGFDTQRILNEYDMAKAQVIIPQQQYFRGVIEKIFYEVFNRDITGQIQFINRAPVKNDKVWKVWELRRDEGLDYDEKDPEQNKYVSQLNSKPSV